MSFAYLHECFPDPTKTFVYREVAAMVDLGMAPAVYSIRRPSAEECGRMEAIDFDVRYLPPEDELRESIERDRGSFSSAQRRALSHWRAQKGDSTRVFEALWLGRELKRQGVRHVHAHFAAMAARTAWLIRELWGITYSFTGHADDIFSPERKPVTLEMLVEKARFIATETDYSRERLTREYPAARGKTFRVFNGIRLDITPEAGTEGGATPRIVSVGRLVEKKGFPRLLQVCAELRRRNVAFACDIVGAGPLESALRNQVAELDLGSHVILHGAQPQAVTRKLIGQGRVFALAAQVEGDGGSDNLPTVIMEAMASAVPVVSTRVAGIPEMVDDGRSGRIVEVSDLQAFASAIVEYLADPELARRHGAEGRLRAIEKFAVEKSARELAELLVLHAGVAAPAAAIQKRPELGNPVKSGWLCRLLGLSR